MDIDCLIFENVIGKDCLLLVSMEVEELSAHLMKFTKSKKKVVLELNLDNNNF